MRRTGRQLGLVALVMGLASGCGYLSSKPRVTVVKVDSGTTIQSVPVETAGTEETAVPAAAGRPTTPAKVVTIQPGPNVQEAVQTALIKAKPGTVIEFSAGTFAFTRGLSLAEEGVTIRGQGMDKTILSFKGQTEGSAGLLVSRGRFTIENLTVEDTAKDAVKVGPDVEGVTFRGVKAQWTGGPKATNGAYGIYPVQCRNVLVDGCVAIGAADAGIYVGQSHQVIVRNCKAMQNVAGIEIENTTDADVHDNEATDNAGGLLVFDLPDLQVKNGGRVRVFKNKVHANNHANFAPEGAKVATVAPGTGLMVLATDQVELFDNTAADNQTFGLLVASYYTTGNPIKDAKYDPIPEGIYVHDNKFSGNGTKPAGPRAELLKLLLGERFPDIVYDGVVDPKKPDLAPNRRLALKNNGTATFADLQWGELLPQLAQAKGMEEMAVMALSHQPKINRETKPFEGELPALKPVTLSGGR